ncbi:MAG: ABC transporter ATP-binding protein [Desulforhopalus sp.]
MNSGDLYIKDLKFLDKGPFSFSVRRGECVGLSGRSGIGKTQLLRAVTDLIPHEGILSLGGKLCSSYPAPVWRSLVTMVFADSSWWYDRVGDHFAEVAGDTFVETYFPKLGLERDMLQWQVRRLSTGERQRLALLRTLQRNPAVLLLDEPSSGLDGYHTDMLEVCIKGLRLEKNMSVIWVSHDPEQLKRVTMREMRMEENGLVELGHDPS